MKIPVFVSFLLMPFSIVYGWITKWRNDQFDYSKKAIEKVGVPVISVGNLKAGGTGKTPMVRYILDFLFEIKAGPAFISRGYGRKTKGYRSFNDSIDPQQIGDEPAMIKAIFPQLHGGVCEKRVTGAQQILRENKGIDVLVSDDSYQHRHIYRDIDIMLTSYNDFFYNDYPFPSGLLREGRVGAGRADIIIVTKCPEKLSKLEIDEIARNIQKYNEKAEIYFTTISYGAPRIDLEGKSVFGFSAIANNEIFKSYLSQHFDLKGFTPFNDHHEFSAQDLQKLQDMANEKGAAVIVCTEKDYIKIKKLLKDEVQLPVTYIPIKSKFLRGEDRFRNKIQSIV